MLTMNDMIENSGKSFRLPRMLTMSNVEETKRGFLEAAPDVQEAIDASGVETIDLVGMQLIIAMLGGNAGADHLRLGAPSASVARAFQRAGVPLPVTP